MNKVNLLSFHLKNFFLTPACCDYCAQKAKHLDVKTMSTCSHANMPIGQSERAYYFSYFINSCVINISMITFQFIVNP